MAAARGAKLGVCKSTDLDWVRFDLTYWLCELGKASATIFLSEKSEFLPLRVRVSLGDDGIKPSHSP